MSQQINLYNPVFLAQKKYFSAVAMAQSLGLLLVALVLVHVFAWRQAASLERLLADTARQSDQRRAQLVVLGRQYSSEGTSKTLERDLARAQEQLRNRTELLGQIKTSVGSNAEGFAVFLTALARQSVPGVWLTGVDVGTRNQLVLKGRALRPELVPAYVAALSRERALAGRPLSSLEVRARDDTGRGAQQAGQIAQRYVEFVLNIPLGEAQPPAQRGAS